MKLINFNAYGKELTRKSSLLSDEQIELALSIICATVVVNSIQSIHSKSRKFKHITETIENDIDSMINELPELIHVYQTY